MKQPSNGLSAPATNQLTTETLRENPHNNPQIMVHVATDTRHDQITHFVSSQSDQSMSVTRERKRYPIRDITTAVMVTISNSANRLALRGLLIALGVLSWANVDSSYA